MTVNAWLTHAQATIQAAGFASAKIDSQLLLSSVLDKPKEWLLTHGNESLSPQAQDHANQLLTKRTANEPMAYILGHKEFYGLSFKTDNRALIPRWESECLVQAAVDWLKTQDKPCVVAEIGTGCGAIVIALAHTLPEHTYTATELSKEALALAQANANLLLKQSPLSHLDPITFLQGDLGQPLLTKEYVGKVDLLVANLPYIPTDLLVSLDPTITYYEPRLALEGGATGIELYKQFMPQAKELLAPGGLLLCEHEFDHGEAMRQLAQVSFPEATITTKQDYLGHDRFLSCEKS